MKSKKMVIVSAPSGAGKTTIVKYIIENVPQLQFSISACSREKRHNEIDGKDYYFISAEDFKNKIANDEFVEWEEVYEDKFYGTLKSELERIWSLQKYVIFDVDVKGGVNIKKMYGDDALSLFIMPTSIEILEERLRNRKTNSEDDIVQRVEKAEYELTFKEQFDRIIINDDLNVAQNEALNAVKDFLEQ